MRQRIHFITKKFAHHSRYSGYDRILDFVPHAPLPFFPAASFFDLTYKEEEIAACSAKWDHYGIDEIDTELDIRFFPALFRKRIFHFIYGENTFCYSADSNRANKIFIATYHQPESWFKSFSKPRYDYFTSRMKKLDAIIAVSSDQAEFFRQFNDNVFCVHHGIDTDFFTPSSDETRDPNLCLFVGNWLRDFETLREVSKLLKARYPQIRVEAVTPAKNFPLLEGAEIIPFSGLTDQELRAKYRKASVALLPLKDCTANNSALEAMACGLPIVVTDIGGIRDYLDESCAIFCQLRASEQMSDAILFLLDDSKKRSSMGHAARKKAEEHFAWPVVAQYMMKVYQQV